jgi:hypothetical protein
MDTNGIATHAVTRKHDRDNTSPSPLPLRSAFAFDSESTFASRRNSDWARVGALPARCTSYVLTTA